MRREASVSGLAAALLAALGAASPAARAATIVVISAGDPGAAVDCTLRQAIVTTNNGSTPGSGEGNCRGAASGTFGADDTIHFDAAVFPKNGVNTILLNGNELAINAYKLTIDATANGNVIIDAQQASRVMYDNNQTWGSSLTLNHLTLSNGKALTTCAGWQQGGGVCAKFANLALNDCTLSDNKTGDVGTSGGFGGAVAAHLGTITLTRCTLSRNWAARWGGAIMAESGLTLIDSTVSGNSAVENGGGIYSSNNGVTLTNSTVAGNTAGNGGGLYVGGIFNPVALTQATVAGNSATSGGGLFISGSGPTVVSENSLFASGTSGGNIAGPSGGITINGGGNLVFGDGLVNASFTSSPATGDPQLGPLQNNGGPTLTMLPAGSAAINVATCLAGITTDQRGMLRPDPASVGAADRCDIGAVEAGSIFDEIFFNGFEP